MSSTRRYYYALRPSRWRQKVVLAGTLAIALALLWVCRAALPGSSAAVHVLLSVSTALLLCLSTWRERALCMALESQGEPEGRYGFWLQQPGGPNRPEPEQMLPRLQHYRRYFCLYYLRSAHAEQLIWPDSLDAQAHRTLRVWLATIQL